MKGVKGVEICSEKPTAVLLHGWMGCRNDMESSAEIIVSFGFNVITIDLPYHGESINCRPSSIQEATRNILFSIAGILQPSRVENRKIIFLGYSLGGRIALEIVHNLNDAIAFDLAISAVVNISAAPPPQTTEQCSLLKAQSTTLANKMRSLTSKQEFKEWLLEWYSGPMWGGIKESDQFMNLLSARIECYSPLQKDSWAKAVLVLNRSMMCIPRSKCSVPMLYICGENDSKYTGFSQVFAEQFETIKFHIMRNAGHNVLLEKKCILDLYIIPFLEQLTL